MVESTEMTAASTGRVSPFDGTALDPDHSQSLVESSESRPKNVVELDVSRQSSKFAAATSTRQTRSRPPRLAGAGVSRQVLQVNGVDVRAVGIRLAGPNHGTFLADVEFPIDVAELAGLHDRAFVEVTIRSSGMRKHVEAGLSSLSRFDELEVHTVLVRVVDLDDEYLVVDLLDPSTSY